MSPQASISNLSEWELSSSIVEMQITSKSLRLCPELKYDISGLDPYKVYSASIILERIDDYKYSFQNNQWCPWSAIDEPAIPQLITHKSGPQSGAIWMAESIDFSWILISTKPKEHTFTLETKHCYQPRLVLASEGEEFYFEDAIQKFIPVSKSSQRRLLEFKGKLRELTGKPVKSMKRAATTSSQEPKPKIVKKKEALFYTPYDAPTSTRIQEMKPKIKKEQSSESIPESHIPPVAPPTPSFNYQYQHSFQYYNSPTMLQNHYYNGFPTSSSPFLQNHPIFLQSPSPLQYNSLTGSPTTSDASTDNLDVFNEFFYPGTHF